jgi:hypothetical protein
MRGAEKRGVGEVLRGFDGEPSRLGGSGVGES